MIEIIIPNLGIISEAATSRKVVGKLGMTVLKMCPKLGHIFPLSREVILNL